MILSCCFGNSNNKQKKKEDAGKGNTSLQEYECEPLRQKHNVSGTTSARRNSSDPSLRGRYQQEKYPPSKKEKRILKQRSQDSLSSSLIRPNASSQPRCQSEVLPSPPETPRVQERPGRASRPQSGTDPGPGVSVKVSRSEVSVCEDGAGKETQAMVEEAHKHCEVTNVQSSLGISENREFQSQIDKDQVRLKDLEIEKLKEDHNLMIEKLKQEHKLATDQVRQLYTEKLEREVSASRTESQQAVLKITNEANESISRLTEQLEAEKAKILQEQEETVEELRRELREREEKLSEAFQGISDREEAWQEEKAEVVLEVGRLKAEASKMVNLLALEYEEENLSEEKKRSLSAEVYSLQLVVDMRTGEVRNLRDQLASLTHQLELMQDVQTKLDKANNRIEDLEEQLKLKVQSEQLLSAQRDQLETTVSNSSREVERMSQNVEELQWRIRNNYELPVEICSSQRPTQLRFDRLTSSEMDEIPPTSRQSQQQDDSSQVQNTEQTETEDKKNSLFVSPEMLEATSTDTSENAVQDSPVTTSDYSSNSSNSPNSDLYLEEDLKLHQEKEQVEESDGNNNIHHEEGHMDSDSLDDEGLGDISSEGENAESPLPSEPSSVPTKSLGEIVNTSCEPPAGAKTSTKSDELSTKLYQATEKERRPSRISFETPL